MFAIARQARVGLEVQATAAGITIDKWLLDHVDDEALQCVVSVVVEVHAVARDVIRAERVEE